jgi:hypothetical protein
MYLNGVEDPDLVKFPWYEPSSVEESKLSNRHSSVIYDHRFASIPANKFIRNPKSGQSTFEAKYRKMPNHF